MWTREEPLLGSASGSTRGAFAFATPTCGMGMPFAKGNEPAVPILRGDPIIGLPLCMAALNGLLYAAFLSTITSASIVLNFGTSIGTYFS